MSKYSIYVHEAFTKHILPKLPFPQDWRMNYSAYGDLPTQQRDIGPGKI